MRNRENILLNVIIGYLDSTNVSYKCLAFTGIVASLLKGCKTLHLRFRIPLNLNSTKLSSLIIIGSKELYDLNETKVILINEITIVQKSCLNFIDY